MPNPSMNNDNVSNKRAFMIATVLSAVLLAASSITSLGPTRAFALDITVPEVDLGTSTVFAEEPNQNSNGEDEQGTSGSSSSSDDTATTEASPVNAETSPNSNSEEDTSRVEEDDFVTADPIVQTNAGADVNVDVEADVVMDEEDCEEANSDISQRNERVAEQQANREGRQGENSLYVSPSVQTDQHLAFNLAMDTDIVLVEGCNPTDNIEQESVVVSDQGLDSVIEQPSSGSSSAITPSYQTQNLHNQNMILNEDIIRPVAGL
jgi:hypothetical protein